LEEQNPDFFKSYNIRLMVKEQIAKFNFLVNQQSMMMKKNEKNSNEIINIENSLNSQKIEETEDFEKEFNFTQSLFDSSNY
jgi:hypothetical protein